MANQRRRRRPPPPTPPAPASEPVSPASSGGGAGAGSLAAIPSARLGAGAGVVFALLSFLSASLLAVGEVRPADPSAEVAARFVEQRGPVSAGIVLSLLSLFFLLAFVAFVHRWLRTVEGEGGWIATLALAGGVLMVAALMLGVMVAVGGTVLDDYGDDPVLARMLLVLGWQAQAVAYVPTAAFLGGVALVGARSGELPRWITTPGLVLAAGLLLIPVAFLPFLFSTLWIGMVAVTLLTRLGPRRRRR